jgi:hypothetical protein
VAFEEDYYDCILKEMSGELKYNSKWPSQLHEAEVTALKIVVEMAEGNLNCPRNAARENAVKIVKAMLEN